MSLSHNAKEKEKTSKKAQLPLGHLSFAMLDQPFYRSNCRYCLPSDNDNIWYVAVGSGGVWKTENAGTTWTPLFDEQASYSTGCITLDPQNPATVWVGSGENVGGRHVAYGDGIYRSKDGGKSWENMGLKKSEHISKIIVHQITQT